MADKTKIQWTDATWNPVRGCSRVSEGCRNCYAERAAMRMAAPGGAYEGLVQIVNGHSRWTGTVALSGGMLRQPMQWTRGRRIFVNSMSDLFHESLPFEAIDKVFAVMADCPQHTFQILTKRPARMLEYLSSDNPRYTASKVFDLTTGIAGKFDCDIYWPLSNVWLGVSVEDQATADERIPLLLQAPAAVRWVSIEPMLRPVDLTGVEVLKPEGHRPGAWLNALTGHIVGPDDMTDMRLDWVVAGGESGPGARPMHPDWARSLRDQCRAADVPFFFKQWGEWEPCPQEFWHGLGPTGRPPQLAISPEGVTAGGFLSDRLARQKAEEGWKRVRRVGKRVAGRVLDGRTWDEFPEVAECGR